MYKCSLRRVGVVTADQTGGVVPETRESHEEVGVATAHRPPQPVMFAGSGLMEEDDRRHTPPDGSKGRDSLYFNLMLPDRELGVFVYTWVDHHGIAGRLVTAWGPEAEPVAFEVVHGIPMGAADFDDWLLEGLEVRHVDPLRSAEVRYQGNGIELAYDFSGTHDAFGYDRNRDGCPQWMAMNRFEQTGHVCGEVLVPASVFCKQPRLLC